MNSSLSRRRLLQLAAAGALGLPLLRARAAGGRVLTGLAPNPTFDALTSLVLQPLAERYQPALDPRITHLTGQQSTVRALEALRNGPDDGSEVLLAPSSTMTLTPQLRLGGASGRMSDFRAVVPLLESTFVYCIGKGVPADVRTLADYVRWVADTPGKDVFCVPSLGTAAHLMGLTMARGVKLSLKPVAYQGAAAIRKELISGGQPAGALSLFFAHAGIASGELRPLFVGSEKRWPSLPEVPALAELMTTGVDTTETLGFYMRTTVADAKVAELNAATRSVLAAPAFAEFARANLALVRPLGAAAYGEELEAERRRWARLLRTELAGFEN
jgi:tripartite-type tricarboxylate transporter receptor subunit TctC